MRAELEQRIRREAARFGRVLLHPQPGEEERRGHVHGVELVHHTCVDEGPDYSRTQLLQHERRHVRVECEGHPGHVPLAVEHNLLRPSRMRRDGARQRGMGRYGTLFPGADDTAAAWTSATTGRLALPPVGPQATSTSGRPAASATRRSLDIAISVSGRRRQTTEARIIGRSCPAAYATARIERARGAGTRAPVALPECSGPSGLQVALLASSASLRARWRRWKI